MEVKINKEIRNYTETIFFGLSLRQFIFSFLACAIAVVIYFSFKDKMNLEIWIVLTFVSAAACTGVADTGMYQPVPEPDQKSKKTSAYRV